MTRRAPHSFRRFVLPFATAGALLAALGSSGCDDDKKKDGAGASPSASGAVAPAAIPSAGTPVAATSGAPAASASAAPAAAAKADKPIDCGTGPEVTITDPDLDAEIRRKLAGARKKDKIEGPLKVSDLAQVTSLNLTSKKDFDALDPCVFPKLTGLKHLYLGPGKLSDLKPIANLTQLESLRASINEVEDLKPLEKLVLLDRLDLGRTHVRDLTPLEKLVNLTELQLDDTAVSDLTPLAKCTKLEALSIKNTTVTDVSPLKGLTKLKKLTVQGTALTNIDTLQPLVARGLKIIK